MAEEGNKVTPAREFLLGRLSEETRSRFEEGFFDDDELFEQIEIAEAFTTSFTVVRGLLRAGFLRRFRGRLRLARIPSRSLSARNRRKGCRRSSGRRRGRRAVRAR